MRNAIKTECWYGRYSSLSRWKRRPLDVTTNLKGKDSAKVVETFQRAVSPINHLTSRFSIVSDIEHFGPSRHFSTAEVW